MEWIKRQAKIAGGIIALLESLYSALVGIWQKGPSVMLDLGWPAYLVLSLFGFAIGSMLLWSWWQPYRAVERLHALWPQIAGLHGELETAILFNEQGQFRHCEKNLTFLLPELVKLKINPTLVLPRPELTKDNAMRWEKYLLRVAVAAKAKQIREARSIPL